jgi:hypothetical protein
VLSPELSLDMERTLDWGKRKLANRHTANLRSQRVECVPSRPAFSWLAGKRSVQSPRPWNKVSSTETGFSGNFLFLRCPELSEQKSPSTRSPFAHH